MNSPQLRGARGVCIEAEKTPETGYFWQKMQDVLYLFSLAPPELIPSIQNIKAIGD